MRILSRLFLFPLPFLLFLIPFSGFCHAAKRDFFYLQEGGKDSRESCAAIFAALRTRGKEDVGGIVRSLKTINTGYLLDDYDNVMTTDRRKDNYLTYEGLMQEVNAGRRERYCRIELALYLQQEQRFAGPVYAQLVADALQDLDATYAAAKQSAQREDFARAVYAFDLIAPYRDAYDQLVAASDRQDQLRVAQQQAELAATATAAPTPANAVASKDAGPILRAVLAGAAAAAVADPPLPGTIALAARPGPIARTLRDELATP